MFEFCFNLSAWPICPNVQSQKLLFLKKMDCRNLGYIQVFRGMFRWRYIGTVWIWAILVLNFSFSKAYMKIAKMDIFSWLATTRIGPSSRGDVPFSGHWWHRANMGIIGVKLHNIQNHSEYYENWHFQWAGHNPDGFGFPVGCSE